MPLALPPRLDGPRPCIPVHDADTRAGAGEATTLDLHFRSPGGLDASLRLTLPQLRTGLGTSQRAVFAVTRESCGDILLDVVRWCGCAQELHGSFWVCSPGVSEMHAWVHCSEGCVCMWMCV